MNVNTRLSKALRHCAPAALWALALGSAPHVVRAADSPPAAAGQDVLTEEQIMQALHPPPPTRAFGKRGLTRPGDTAAAPSAAPGQSINLNIPFESNSSELKPQATAQLKALKGALASDGLKSDRIMVAGHTDAKGSAQYNKQLSLKRAEAVKRYLVGKGIEAGRLDTAGFGSEQLLAPDRPDDASNRRVEIRNLGQAAQ